MALHLAFLGVLLVAASAHAGEGRYLYQVSCSARVDRFDTQTQRRTNTYDLAQRTGKARLVPVASGTLEVCLANQAVFDAAGSLFYTLVPSRAEPEQDGPMTYRILGFSVPGLKLVKQIDAGRAGNDPPRLRLSGRTVQAVDPEKERIASSEDLSTYAPDHQALPNQILETSGQRALLRVTIGSVTAYGVADQRTKTFVRLHDAPASAADNVHLSPGGTHVLVEEVVAVPGANATKTGKLVLYDATTGAVAQNLSSPAIAKLYFRAISPAGMALYDVLDRYQFVDLRRRFPNEPVLRPLPQEFPEPAVFFSDR